MKRPMLFSVVIPTHSRLDLLRDAVETVRRQKYENWELVIFDNASTQNLQDYVAGLGDSRIRCERSDTYLSVTDSWNYAINLSKGDYITFLGDDDGLTPDYFSKLEKSIVQFEEPEVVYFAQYQYFHPGVAPWEPAGYVIELKYGFFFVDQEHPFLLSPEQAYKAVWGSLNLRRNFNFNVHAFAFSQKLLERVRIDGAIFHSPFPDYYFANIVMALSNSIVVIPSPMTIAGVSKSSFGYTLFNGLEEQGAEILNAKLTADPLFPSLEKFLLPGPEYNNNYILTMEHVAKNVGNPARYRINIGRYRRWQIYHTMLQNPGVNWKKSSLGLSIWSRLSLLEKAWAIGLTWLKMPSDKFGKLNQRIQNAIERKVRPHEFEAIVRKLNTGSCTALIDVFNALEDGSLEDGSLETLNKTPVALVYLARCADGLDAFRRFFSSYCKHPAGVPYALAVIYKGFETSDELEEAKKVFDVPHAAIEVDDTGFDIGAYQKAANVLDYELLCFLNTHAEILADNWLSHLYHQISRDSVGIVGPMGSYESLYTSMTLLNKIIFICNKLVIDFDPRIEYYFDWFVRHNCNPWLQAQYNRKQKFGSGPFGSTKWFLAKVKQRLWRYYYHFDWFFRKSARDGFRPFPRFPNPHIRSNGFMVRRETFLNYKAPPIVTKLDACCFESGTKSLTNYVRGLGKAALVVGRDGKGYNVDDWWRSGTFRLDNQDNLIISDNQSRQFENMPPGEKITHVLMTWGDYLKGPPDDYLDFGIKFRVDKKTTGSS